MALWILRWRLVGRLDPLRGGCETGLDVATVARVRRFADADRGRHHLFGAVEPDAGRLGLVGGAQQGAALGRGLERLGHDDGDGLAGVAHAIRLEHVDAEREGIVLAVRIAGECRYVARHHHGDDAGMRLCGRDVERGDAPRAIWLVAITA